MGGRPRSAEVDQALKNAALALFVERGLQGLSLEEVARRASVSRAALYRRWSDREALLADALKSARNSFDSGTQLEMTSLDEVLSHLAERAGIALADPLIRGLLRRLLTLGPEGEMIWRDYREAVVVPRRTMFTRLITAAQDAGEIDRAIDPELAQDAIAGALAYKVISGEAADPGFDGERYTLLLFETFRLRP